MGWLLNLINMKKINLPTKITIARIILAFLLLLSIFIIYFIDIYHPFVYDCILTISTKDDKAIYVNYVMLILMGVFLIASLTDFLDGYIARKYNMVTDLGKFLDPIADKMLINGILIFLCIGFDSCDMKYFSTNLYSAHATIPFFCVILMVIRDLVVDALRLMAATKNVVLSANIFGKLKTVLQMVAIVVVFLNGFPFSFFDYNWIDYLHVSDILCYLATIVSLLSGAIYLIQNKNVFGGNKNE